MNKQILLYVAIGLLAISAIIIVILVNNNKKAKLKKEIDELYTRFNTIKTIPIAFKLNKAQIMAKRNEDVANAVSAYFKKYEESEKHINEIQEAINDLEDEFQAKNYKQVISHLDEIKAKTDACEEEIKDIETFLDDFSRKENDQREFSARLKEEYRLIKNATNQNSQSLSIGLEGIQNRLLECENLFSSSEEWMYGNEYARAQDDLDKIEEILKNLRDNMSHMPSLIKDVKGVLPVMLDEAKREYALTKQRGVYLEHLNVEEKMAKVEKVINEDTKNIIECNVDNVKGRVDDCKDILNTLMEDLATENRSFKETKENSDRALEYIKDLTKVENYVRIAYDKDSARFGLENLQDVLKKQREEIENYQKEYQQICEELASCLKPASNTLDEVLDLLKRIEVDKKEMYAYKTIIDRSNDGESRALSQLVKLQLVISEVETKVQEYRLPTISETYDVDLQKSKDYVKEISNSLAMIPINIEELNTLLDSAIDFVYKFYNNVNNIVGMAIMVENTIVFGNRYRSSFPEIDHELSKAEFQYLNGEYTKALKTAISCMETIFPNNADKQILENS